MRFIIIFLLLNIFVQAKTPYELGKELYMGKGCNSCHGNKADGMHNYPALANRAKGFLAYKLKKFRKREFDTQRQEMMVVYALDLSDTDIENLTTFFADYVDSYTGEEYDYSVGNEGDGGS